jgi:DNA-directed RNA polymerase subunit F
LDRTINAFLRDSETILDYLAQLSLTDKEKCKTYQEDIVAVFEGMGKVRQIRIMLKTIIEARLQQNKSDRLGKFSRVDAKQLISKNGGFAWTYDNVRQILEQANHIKFGWDVLRNRYLLQK